MPDLLTTDEAATYLRLSRAQALRAGGERRGALHQGDRHDGCSRRPRSTAGWRPGCWRRPALAHAPAPPIVGGSHDPLLEWALRESGCGLASLPEGSEAGLRRLARGEVTAAAIHLHRLDGDDEAANVEAVAHAPGLHDAVLIAFARREQGLLVARRQSAAASPTSPSVAAQARAAGAAPARRRRATSAARARSPAPGIALDALDAGQAAPARPAPTSRRRCAPAAPIAASPRARSRRPPGSISCR